MNKPTLFTLTLFSILTPLSIQKAHSQARSAIGFGLGVNRPMTNGYAFSSAWNFQSHIKLAQKFALVPALGVENIESDKKGVYNGYYFEESGRSVNLLFLNVSTKYYINKHLFATAGPSVYIGGESAGSSGFGGTASIGLDLAISARNSFEISFNTSVMPVYQETVPVAGLKAAYKFNFRKR